jgi:hypothetical protein
MILNGIFGGRVGRRSVLRNNATVNANLSPQFSPGGERGKNIDPCGSTGHPLAPLSLREARKKKARGDPCASLSLSLSLLSLASLLALGFGNLLGDLGKMLSSSLILLP